MAALLRQVAGATETRRGGDLNRISGKLKANLEYSQIEDVARIGAHTFISDIMDSCNQIHDALYDAYFNYTIEEEFS